jgi:hypothetical protein
LILEHLSDNKAPTERKKPVSWIPVEAEQGKLGTALLELLASSYQVCPGGSNPMTKRRRAPQALLFP